MRHIILSQSAPNQFTTSNFGSTPTLATFAQYHWWLLLEPHHPPGQSAKIPLTPQILTSASLRRRPVFLHLLHDSSRSLQPGSRWTRIFGFHFYSFPDIITSSEYSRLCFRPQLQLRAIDAYQIPARKLNHKQKCSCISLRTKIKVFGIFYSMRVCLSFCR